MRSICAVLLLLLASFRTLTAQETPQLSQLTRGFVSVEAPTVVLKHVRVIDGTAGRPAENQVIVIANGSITYVGDSAKAPVIPDAKVVDLAGHTVTPGFFGLHDHFYYAPLGEPVRMVTESFPRLYLAGGVTTIRTSGAFFPYQELAVKAAIDRGDVPGPNMQVSVSVLSSAPTGGGFGSNHPRAMTPEQVKRVVDYWVDEGATWFGEQLPATRALMGELIAQAHRRGVRVTGHICSVTHREAVALGIDNIEHGLVTATDYMSDKPADVCPPGAQRSQAGVDVGSEAVKKTFAEMMAKNVGMTSTLSVYELFVPGRPPSPALEARILEMLAPEMVPPYQRWRESVRTRTGPVNILEPELFEKMMQYDLAFYRAGGTLAAGVDPWGNGSLPGFGNQRNYEILVEAGFTPAEAIQVMSANGAKILGVADRYGTIAADKRADLVVIKGNPVQRPSDIYNVTLVFKDGVGYDSAKLLESVKGSVGGNRTGERPSS